MLRFGRILGYAFNTYVFLEKYRLAYYDVVDVFLIKLVFKGE